MALPVNINDLIHGRTVEWERLEFKAGWNPLESIQTICAFANDINNWGGGYLIIGIEQKSGTVVLPPKGLDISRLDDIQKELMGLCHQMQPSYFPIAEPVEYGGKTILVAWVPGGESRPYKAPDSLARKRPRGYSYYIRRLASTRKANHREEQDLIRMSASTPFDDRVNQNAELTDLQLPLIQSHLAAIGSDLQDQTTSLPFGDLARRMNIATGADEFLKPKNIGLLFFNNNPTAFFPCAKIDVVQFKDQVGDNFTEKEFSGPVQVQLQDVLLYIKNHIISERVTKIPGKAEAQRVFNYPYEAVEEALVNTVYHRSYEDDSPIELRVFPDRLELISYPGPLPPLNRRKLRAGNITARKYRNRRMGDLLKELHLTEGRGTGIPKIRRAMQRNGSPKPTFDTDKDLSFFLTVLPLHPAWVQEEVQEGVQDKVQDRKRLDDRILKFCLRPKKRKEIMDELGLGNNQSNYLRYVGPLVEDNFLARTIPKIPNSKNQQYLTTPKGEARTKKKPENPDQQALL